MVARVYIFKAAIFMKMTQVFFLVVSAAELAVDWFQGLSKG